MKTSSRPERLDGVPPESARHPSFGEAFLFWLKLGFISFGGPTGQIAIMHTELVEKKKWISEARFLHALNYCMLLPGPEAQQLATYVGWLLHKTWGGIVAGAFFVIPSIFILRGLSYIYVTLGNLPWIAGIFYGLKPDQMEVGHHPRRSWSGSCGFDIQNAALQERLACIAQKSLRICERCRLVHS
jgi:chromate transporter